MQSFKLIDKKQNPSLGFNAERYELDEYGSEHIHLKNDSKEIVFMVMFRTIPEFFRSSPHPRAYYSLWFRKLQSTRSFFHDA